MPTGDVARLGWHGFLSRWNDQTLSIVRGGGLELGEPMARFANGGSLWRPPASKVDIERREHDLGVEVSESLRGFFLVSDGWRSAYDREYTIHPLARVAWLSEADPGFLHAWQDPRSGVPEIGPEYDDYGPNQDPVFFRTGHLRYCLTLSSTEDDASTYLLNTARRDSGGELEAWDVNFRLPGAYRFRSFAELMEVVFQEEMQWLLEWAEHSEL